MKSTTGGRQPPTFSSPRSRDICQNNAQPLPPRAPELFATQTVARNWHGPSPANRPFARLRHLKDPAAVGRCLTRPFAGVVVVNKAIGAVLSAGMTHGDACPILCEAGHPPDLSDRIARRLCRLNKIDNRFAISPPQQTRRLRPFSRLLHEVVRNCRKLRASRRVKTLPGF